MSDLLHTHVTFGLRPSGACPACDQLVADMAVLQQVAAVPG